MPVLGFSCRSQILYLLFVLSLVDKKCARGLSFAVLEFLVQSFHHLLEV